MDGTDPRKERTRQKVLAAALDLLHEEGWEGLNRTRVAERASVGRATVYRHWPDAGDLLFDTLAAAKLQDHSVPTGDLRRDLVNELLAFRKAMDKNRFGRIMTALIDRAEWDEQLATIRRRVAASGTSVLSQIITTARASGQLPPTGDDQLLIAQLVGPISFLRFHTGKPITKRFITDIVHHALKDHGTTAPE